MNKCFHLTPFSDSRQNEEHPQVDPKYKNHLEGRNKKGVRRNKTGRKPYITVDR